MIARSQSSGKKLLDNQDVPDIERRQGKKSVLPNTQNNILALK
jgi:hypothetical protein